MPVQAKSPAIAFEMRVKEALLKANGAHPLFDKERRVQTILTLAFEMCDHVGLFGPILHTALGVLESAIYSDEADARAFFGCGIFSDTATVAEIQARASYKNIPCFLLLDIARTERTNVLEARTQLQDLQTHVQSAQSRLVVNERMLRKEVNEVMGELAETQDKAAQAKCALENVTNEGRQQQRDMTASTLSLQREMQAMNAAITRYQSEIRDLRHERAATDALRKEFERVRCPHAAKKAGGVVVAELLQSLQTQMQLLLLRNTRVQEYDRDLRLCSPDMQSKHVATICAMWQHLLTLLLGFATISSATSSRCSTNTQPSKRTPSFVPMEIYHFVDSSFIQDQMATALTTKETIAMIPDQLRALVEPSPSAPETSLWVPFSAWHPQPIPKCIPRLSVDELDDFFAHLWAKISTVERKWLKWSLEHERDKKQRVTSDDANQKASDVLPLPLMCAEYIEDRYGEPRIAVITTVAILQAIDTFVEQSAQLDLFGSVFAGTLDQSAWWYLMLVKSHVAQLELDITSDHALRLVGKFLLLPRGDVNVVQSLSLDAFVASVHLHVRGELTSAKFFDWLATRIMIADDLHFKASKQILFRNDGATLTRLSLVQFSKNVLDCVHLPRALISRYFRSMCESPTTDTVALDHVVYMLAYIQLANPSCRSV
ncbi:Aste57867_25304 [Aphanomyces stellatus]|uniref:Aste57867_25304 protein n=1 Tax=Aphanomyces stellatus TaxID=120398 RepID=A0A485LSW5_9STRA|nr:hypothetical protein As57867_025226 [Aphanomyces stellatus]VFU01929.1 Aste57867_25304 [Aphanomyces stellatus]